MIVHSWQTQRTKAYYMEWSRAHLIAQLLEQLRPKAISEMDWYKV